MAYRGGPWPSRRSLRCGKPGGTMQASSPTEVALTQGLWPPGWFLGLSLAVGVGFIPPVEPCVNAGVRLAARPATAWARKNKFPNVKKRPRHVAGPWFDTQGIHARKGCGRDGAGPPGGLRAGPDSGQLRTFTKWRPPPHRKAGLGQAGPQYTAVPGGGPRGGRS